MQEVCPISLQSHYTLSTIYQILMNVTGFKEREVQEVVSYQGIHLTEFWVRTQIYH